MKLLSTLRTLAHVGAALLPPVLKPLVYRRLFGFDVANGAHIGLSILDVDQLTVKAGARIGHGNVLYRTRRVQLDENAHIGFCNLLRGGDEIALGRYATILRFNVINSIPDNDATTRTDPRFVLGAGAYVVSGHHIDFTDRIRLGKNTIVAGRNSSLWTHNRQETRPIEVGDFCYLGSEVKVAPGARLGDQSILGMGGVLAGEHAQRQVLGGVPAKPIRALTEKDEKALAVKTRRDIPEDEY